MELCVALDMPSKTQNLKLVYQLKGLDIWLKVGLRAFVRDGTEFIKDIKNIDNNFKIFLDLKLYDIPNTMASTALELAKLDIDMFNIHASSGKIAMKQVMDVLKDIKNRPKIIAVTALTSFDNKLFEDIYHQNIQTKAKQFAIQAYEAGLDGVVCSVFESKTIKNTTNDKFMTVTPGIRPFDEVSNDQFRVGNIKAAKDEMVDMIVVGRPIYEDKNPPEKTREILNNISKKTREII
ncbi:MAG: orotidine 5'-phosphate decarboxylase [Campylobacteraceae bacterium 4484_166]|nr:MAG: orotidine 5'-phosphate decarboxylase [Campylobacteraceae bacterium 4484_166]